MTIVVVSRILESLDAYLSGALSLEGLQRSIHASRGAIEGVPPNLSDAIDEADGALELTRFGVPDDHQREEGRRIAEDLRETVVTFLDDVSK